MSVAHGLFADLSSNHVEGKNEFAKVDRPKGMENTIVGNGPDASAGQIGIQNFADQLNTQSQFNYFGLAGEKYSEILKPRTFLTKPLSLWLYCSAKDREKFFQEMRLLIENFDNYFFTDRDTINLQCWQITFVRKEIYYLVLKRYPKMIHKVNPEYHFLGCEIIRTKLTINDILSDDNKKTRCLTTTYCYDLKMDGFHQYMNEFGKLSNKIAYNNWVYTQKGKSQFVKAAPIVNFNDSRLSFQSNFHNHNPSEKDRYFQFWSQNDTVFGDTYDRVKRGYDVRKIDIGIRNYMDHVVAKISKDPEKSKKYYEKYGHGLREGVNMKYVEIEENGKKVNRVVLIPNSEPKGPILSERSKTGNIKFPTKKIIGVNQKIFDQIEVDSIATTKSCAIINEEPSEDMGSDIQDGNELACLDGTNPQNSEFLTSAVMNYWDELIKTVGENDVDGKHNLTMEKEIIMGEIEKKHDVEKVILLKKTEVEIQQRLSFFKLHRRLPASSDQQGAAANPLAHDSETRNRNLMEHSGPGETQRSPPSNKVVELPEQTPPTKIETLLSPPEQQQHPIQPEHQQQPPQPIQPHLQQLPVQKPPEEKSLLKPAAKISLQSPNSTLTAVLAKPVTTSPYDENGKNETEKMLVENQRKNMGKSRNNSITSSNGQILSPCTRSRTRNLKRLIDDENEDNPPKLSKLHIDVTTEIAIEPEKEKDQNL